MNIWIVGAVIVALLALAGIIMLRASVRDVPKDQRLAIVRLGTFKTLGGPGRTRVLPLVERAVVLSVDDVGSALVEGQAEFGGVEIPVRASAFFEAGEAVQIIGFDRDQAAVIVKA
jgi:hypothetical protein